MDNRIQLNFPSDEKIIKAIRPYSERENEVIEKISDEQIWSNKSLMKVIKALSRT